MLSPSFSFFLIFLNENVRIAFNCLNASVSVDLDVRDAVKFLKIMQMQNKFLKKYLRSHVRIHNQWFECVSTFSFVLNLER